MILFVMILQVVRWRRSPLLKEIVVALLCGKGHVVFIVTIFKGLAFVFVPSLLHLDSILFFVPLVNFPKGLNRVYLLCDVNS